MNNAKFFLVASASKSDKKDNAATNLKFGAGEMSSQK